MTLEEFGETCTEIEMEIYNLVSVNDPLYEKLIMNMRKLRTLYLIDTINKKSRWVKVFSEWKEQKKSWHTPPKDHQVHGMPFKYDN